MSISGQEYIQADLSEQFIKNLLAEYDKFKPESTEFKAFEDQVKLFALELKSVNFDYASAHFSREIPETEELANVQGEAQKTKQLLEKHKQFMHDRQESSDEYRMAVDEIESKFQKAREAMKVENRDFAAIRVHEAMKDLVEKKDQCFSVETVVDLHEQQLLDEHNCRKVKDGLYVSRDVYVIAFNRARKLVNEGYYHELKPFIEHRELTHEPHPDRTDNATFVFRKAGSAPDLVNKPIESKSIFLFKLDELCKPKINKDIELLADIAELRILDWVLTHEPEGNYK